jgi:predicted nucleic acid-binding protein
MTVAIVDTGPLVAFFDRAERHHRWVMERFEELDAPLLVCEPVLAEAMYLLARYPKAQDTLLGLIEDGALAWPSGSMSISARYANCCKNTGTHRCRWPMHASFGCRKSMIGIPC